MLNEPFIAYLSPINRLLRSPDIRPKACRTGRSTADTLQTSVLVDVISLIMAEGKRERERARGEGRRTRHVILDFNRVHDWNRDAGLESIFESRHGR